jgi:hypothetical protein
VDDEVADHGCCNESRQSQKVGDVVDVLMADSVKFERGFEARCEFGGCRWRWLMLLGNQ